MILHVVEGSIPSNIPNSGYSTLTAEIKFMKNQQL